MRCLIHGSFYRVPAMGKITFKLKDEIMSKYSVSEMVTTKPKACYAKNLHLMRIGPCIILILE